MIKKIIITSLCLTFATPFTSSAGDSLFPSSKGSSKGISSFPAGFYIGAAGGYTRTKSSVKGVEAAEVDPPNTVPFLISGNDNNINAFSLLALAGYVHRFNHTPFTVGIEAFISLNKGENEFEAQKEDPNPGGNFEVLMVRSKIRDQYEIGLKALLGVVFCEAYHLYGAFGVSRGRYKILTSLINSPQASFESNQRSKSLALTNYIFGVGVERGFRNIKIGLEYLYKFTNGKSSTENNLTNSLGNELRTSTSRHIKNSQSIMAKVTYTF